MNSPETPLKEALAQRILVMDGAMGTVIQGYDLGPDDFGGAAYEGCNEHLVLTRPDVVREIHDAYLEAGADVIETNTFGATSLVLAEYDLQAKAREINRQAAEIARASARAHSTEAKPRWVAGSIGPTTKAITVTGGVTFEELVETYREQALGLLEGGVDSLLVETSQDTLNVKAAALGIEAAFAEIDKRVPLMLSCTIEPMGTMLAGQGVEAFHAAIEHLSPLSVGLNCATGPEFMTDHLRTLSEISPFFVSVYPNAGLPDENGEYDETPESLARKLARFVDAGWVNLVGGCCGTTPDHVRAIAELVEGKSPRKPSEKRRRVVSGIEVLEVTGDPNERPILVGERTNVIGSRKFKRLIEGGKYEEASEIARAQVKGGAQVMDVCLADPDRDEVADVTEFLGHVTKKVKVPLMIDSTDAAVIERALRMVPGKAIVNSINLEDGEERFEQVCPLLRKYGAAVVVGCIDEDKNQGMAVTADRKVAVAERSYDLLVNKYGIPPEDIVFDPLVFPAGTGDENYIGSAGETIEGVRRITERFPRCTTILGISNVSFGLPPAGREVLNSVFLYHCVQAGLTYAIVNTEKLERYASIPEEERKLSEDILFWRGDDPVAAFTAHFRGKEPRAAKPKKTNLTLDERLANYIVEGTKEGLVEDLDLALAERAPLDVINGPLMGGMAEVGRLFNDNQLIVAEVLQSAEAMKAAVSHLEPHMEKKEDGGKGRILLATVKGDVHDIGKNLVDIILTNNGFEVVNLGIKVPPEDLIKAVRDHKPHAIGLSGLLVKSAQQMVITAEDLKAAGVDLPILVGGAALSKRFANTKIASAYEGPVLYARDAMQGLDLSNALFSKERDALLARVREEQVDTQAKPAVKRTTPKEGEHVPVKHDLPAPRSPDLKRHVLRNVDVRQVWPYVNPLMLYSKHLGLKGDIEKLLAKEDEKARKLHDQVEELKREIVAKKALTVHGVYRFFPAASDGDALLVYDPDAPGEKVLEQFTFSRQTAPPKRCLSDFVRPVGGELDHVAFFAVTAGEGVRDLAEQYKAEGAYLKSHALQALALETAEAFAERLHQRIRNAWGFPDPADLAVRDLFKKKYRGCRYSFGYPACPELADQEKLWRLIHPDEIGIDLTEGYMMDPEASVSALVVHHPDANYFDVR